MKTLLLLFLLTAPAHQVHDISKRYVLFPRYTVLQFTYGLSVPLILPSRSINLSLCVQANYDLPWNLTNFEPLYGRADDGDFDMDRNTFYEYAIALLDSFGLDGEECLLRAICEISEVPLHTNDRDNLLEMIVHFILTPSLDKTMNGTLHGKLLVAEHLGRVGGGCDIAFPECTFNLVDVFTNKFLFT